MAVESINRNELQRQENLQTKALNIKWPKPGKPGTNFKRVNVSIKVGMDEFCQELLTRAREHHQTPLKR